MSQLEISTEIMGWKIIFMPKLLKDIRSLPLNNWTNINKPFSSHLWKLASVETKKKKNYVQSSSP